MIFALKRQYQRLCMSRDLNGQRTKCAIHISVSLSSKRCMYQVSTYLHFWPRASPKLLCCWIFVPPFYFFSWFRHVLKYFDKFWLFGHFWTFLDAFGRIWTFLDVVGHFLKFLDIFGRIWSALDIFWLIWTFLDTFGHILLVVKLQIGTIWAF